MHASITGGETQPDKVTFIAGLGSAAGTRTERIANGAMVLAFGRNPERIDADTLVIAKTNVPEPVLSDEIGVPVVGDANPARTVP